MSCAVFVPLQRVAWSRSEANRSARRAAGEARQAWQTRKLVWYAERPGCFRVDKRSMSLR
jgi:hypothetical protein